MSNLRYLDQKIDLLGYIYISFGEPIIFSQLSWTDKKVAKNVAQRELQIKTDSFFKKISSSQH